jgi:D-arabinose 5-phosphate isomerase GutQ
MTNSETDLIVYLSQFLEKEAQSILGLKEFINEEFITLLKKLLKQDGRIFMVGVGTSGVIAKRAAHLFSCIEMPVSYLHPSDSLHGASGTIQAGDTVIIFSKGGKSDEVNTFAKIAKERGAAAIAITEDATSPLGKVCDDVILYGSIENKEQESMIAYSNSLCAGAISDVMCVGLMKLKDYDGSTFGAIHPGGAVGKTLNKK